MKFALRCYMQIRRSRRRAYAVLILYLGLTVATPMRLTAAEATPEGLFAKATAAAAKMQIDFQHWLDHAPNGRTVKQNMLRGRDLVTAPGLAALDALHLDPRGSGPTLFGRELVNPRGWWGWALAVLVSWWAWTTAWRTRLYLLRPLGLSAPEDVGDSLRWGVPWRPFYKWIWEPVTWWARQLSQGRRATSGWAPLAWVMCQTFRRGDSVPLGVLQWKGIRLWQPVAYRGPMHVNFCGASGGGKSTALLNILGTLHRNAPGAFVVDCDAAMYHAVGDWLRAEGHRVILIDPNNLAGGTDGYNALDEITHAVRRGGIAMAVPTAAKIADALIIPENHHQPLWDNGARDFLTALILFVWLFREDKSLNEVRRLLANGMTPTNPKDDPFMELLFQMMETQYLDDGCGGKISRAQAGA